MIILRRQPWFSNLPTVAWLFSHVASSRQRVHALSSSSLSSSPSPSSTTTTLSELLARPYIQDAIKAQPKTPQSVLSFYYGVDYQDVDSVHENLVLGACLAKMQSLWFGGGPQYDDVCGYFVDEVRRVGRGEWNHNNNNDDNNNNKSNQLRTMWSTTVDGLMAQLILCDQISRNIFRGTAEAYVYDHAALDYANQLSNHILKNNNNNGNNQEDDSMETTTTETTTTTTTLEGTLYPPYLASIVMALMHSEVLAHHDNALKLLHMAKEEQSPKNSLVTSVWWENQLAFELEHKKVLDQFGRYPHRNKVKGRSNTPQEEEWLAAIDHLPGWALSQGGAREEENKRKNPQ